MDLQTANPGYLYQRIPSLLDVPTLGILPNASMVYPFGNLWLISPKAKSGVPKKPETIEDRITHARIYAVALGGNKPATSEALHHGRLRVLSKKPTTPAHMLPTTNAAATSRNIVISRPIISTQKCPFIEDVQPKLL